jgi:hypothetical protein
MCSSIFSDGNVLIRVYKAIFRYTNSAHFIDSVILLLSFSSILIARKFSHCMAFSLVPKVPVYCAIYVFVLVINECNKGKWGLFYLIATRLVVSVAVI